MTKYFYSFLVEFILSNNRMQHNILAGCIASERDKLNTWFHLYHPTFNPNESKQLVSFLLNAPKGKLELGEALSR